MTASASIVEISEDSRVTSDWDGCEAESRSATPPLHVPGEIGIWVFIFGDLVVFGIFFLTFGYYRREEASLFLASQKAMDLRFGVLNTFILLTSSLFAALAIRSARRDNERHTRRFITLAIMCGVGFFMVKCLEYSAKYIEGYTPQTNDFFVLYFMFTGIHLLHVTIGVGVLLVIRGLAVRPGVIERVSSLESGVSFWHLVDLLWVILFSLFYVVRPA